MSYLDQIAEHGNRPQMTVEAYEGFPHCRDNWVICADGFALSVIAGDGAYCSPRPSLFGNLGDVPADYAGPYTACEVGFPSAKPEPWSEWSQYVEDPDAPTETVYAYVPIDLIRRTIEAHGGEVGHSDRQPEQGTEVPS